MATYSFLRLMTGKVVIDIFLSHFVGFWIFLTDMLIEYSSTFHTDMSFVQIVEFDWLPGRRKGYIFKKKCLRIFFPKTKELMKLILCIHGDNWIFLQKCLLSSPRRSI